MQVYEYLDAWIDAHFEQEVEFLQALVQIPTDTPPGNNAPHALKVAQLLETFDFNVEQYAVPQEEVEKYGMQSIINLIVRHHFNSENPHLNDGKTIALNAHGDVVPPGKGWTYEPYGAQIVNGAMYGRATAVSKSDFATFTFALRALRALKNKNCAPSVGTVELHFTYDEEFGGELGPGWLLKNNLTKPQFLIAAGFSYQVVTAHNGCLQMQITVNGKMAHAAIPDTGVDALQGAVRILNKLYEQNGFYKKICSKIEGIKHPYLNVGLIEGGTNTNVVPGQVVFKLDRRMIPEENPQEVEENIRQLILNEAGQIPGLTVEIKRIMLANSMQFNEASSSLVKIIQKHGREILDEFIPAVGTPLYTDVRLYAERGVVGVIYGAGPRTVLESHAKRSDERLQLSDLKAATKVVARTLYDLLTEG